MDFLFGLIFELIGICIEGAYGMLAWNMSIPVIFSGAPKISLLQSIIIALVIEIMTFGGNVYEDTVDTESHTATSIVHIFTILGVSTILLAILWLIMKFIY